jgi:hypothetical protein
MGRSWRYRFTGKPDNVDDIAHLALQNGAAVELRVERSNGDNEYRYHIIVRSNGEDVHALRTKRPDTKYRNYLPAPEPNEGVETDVLFRVYTITEILQSHGVKVEIDRGSLEEHLPNLDDKTKFIRDLAL